MWMSNSSDTLYVEEGLGGQAMPWSGPNTTDERSLPAGAAAPEVGTAIPVFTARQPIFDRGKQVYGYELLFRSGLENRYTAADPDVSTLDVIANSLVDIGLDELTGHRRGFINFTRSLLLQNVAELLPPDLVGIEILESIAPDEEILAACRRAKGAGYVIALDDFVLTDLSNPLLDLADIVKIDFMATTPEERARIADTLSQRKIKALAEKVETEEEFREAADAGYAYFQGYFFSKPTVQTGHALAGNKLSYMRLMEEVSRPELSLDDLEAIIKQDLSLTYKLLRFINSAWFGLRYKIASVKHALTWLGSKEIRTWIYLVCLRDMGADKPTELFLRAMTRAKMGEGVAPPLGMKDKAPELFLMGMFSLIDAVLNTPMEQILDKLPLTDSVKTALAGKPSPFREVHDVITCYERGDWNTFAAHAGQLRLDTGLVPGIFKQSLKWANAAFATTQDD